MLRRRDFLCSAFSAGAVSAQVKPGQSFVYRRVDNCEIRAEVMSGSGSGPRPGVLWIHGGALISGSRKGVRPEQMRRLNEAGFTVVSIDYRLAPETKLPGILSDVQEAYRWLRSQGPQLFSVDPSRIAVAGQSAGGYLTLMCGMMLRPRPKALVSFYGYGDVAAEWYAKPDPFYSRQPAVTREEAMSVVGTQPVSDPPPDNKRGRFYLYTRQQGLWPKLVAGLDPLKERNALMRYCPQYNVKRGHPPTMLLHGDQDTDVPFEQSKQMAEALRRQQIKCEFVEMSGLGHGFDRDMTNPRISAAFDQAVNFLRTHLAA